MRKLTLKFKSSEEHYDADACLVWCFDNRFGDLLGECKKNMGFRYTDDVEVAGGAMSLAKVSNNEDFNFIAEQVFKSVKLHKTPLVVLMVHRDCGAYKALGLSPEPEKLEKDLSEAKNYLAAFLKNKVSKLPIIKTYVADFDGLWEVTS